MSLDTAARNLIELLQRVEEADNAAPSRATDAEKLSAQERKVLRTVGRERNCVMGRIASAICLSLSRATGLIDCLVEKKLVRRERSLEDRRVVQVELTEDGRRAQEAELEARLGAARRLLKSLNAEEQAELQNLLQKISHGGPAGLQA